MTPIKKTFTLGNQQVTLETGEIARQAHGAVLVTIDDTVVRWVAFLLGPIIPSEVLTAMA